MTITLVDSDVHMDIFTRDPVWFGRSAAALARSLTRDATRYRTHFPGLVMVAP